MGSDVSQQTLDPFLLGSFPWPSLFSTHAFRASSAGADKSQITKRKEEEPGER